ncbi:MAG: S-methyl-5-thioribose-1-phosphate isomerase [Promethearchaeota archaeon]
MEPTVKWIDDGDCGGYVSLIDQTKLPREYARIEIRTCARIAHAIKTMEVRGAPAIGATAAMGMALAAMMAKDEPIDSFLRKLEVAKNLLDSTRPTAVNLAWATAKMMAVARSSSSPREITRLLINSAKEIALNDVAINKTIGRNGARLFNDGDGVLTHCNAGALGCVGYGTALGVIRSATAEGKKLVVYSDETRPRLQGARLTCWELQQDGIEVIHVTDAQAGLLMQQGNIQKVIVGADRIVKDAVFNKIGTYGVAIMARYHRIPFYVAAPCSTLDVKKMAKDVVIEERDPSEVKNVLGMVQISPENVPALNYAFDPTPMSLVSAIITEDGIYTPAGLVDEYWN